MAVWTTALPYGSDIARFSALSLEPASIADIDSLCIFHTWAAGGEEGYGILVWAAFVNTWKRSNAILAAITIHDHRKGGFGACSPTLHLWLQRYIIEKAYFHHNRAPQDQVDVLLSGTRFESISSVKYLQARRGGRVRGDVCNTPINFLIPPDAGRQVNSGRNEAAGIRARGAICNFNTIKSSTWKWRQLETSWRKSELQTAVVEVEL